MAKAKATESTVEVKTTFDPSLWMLSIARKYLAEDLAFQMVNEMADNPRFEVQPLDGGKMKRVSAPSLKSVGKSARKVREWTPEMRKAAADRLIGARAAKLGLTADELRTLRLRPGSKPTDEQMATIMAARGEQPATKAKGKAKKSSAAGSQSVFDAEDKARAKLAAKGDPTDSGSVIQQMIDDMS